MAFSFMTSRSSTRRKTVAMSWVMEQKLEPIFVRAKRQNYVLVVDQGHPRYGQTGFIPRRAAISEFDTVRYYHVDFDDGSDRLSQNQLQQVQYRPRY